MLLLAVDLCLNLRTTYYDANGFRENRPKQITMHYLRGWFAIDFVSCLPLGYVEYFTSESAIETSQNNLMKGFRLLKLSKMLRVARIRKVLMRKQSPYP